MDKFTEAVQGHSNFITPPDLVETILILNATDEQVRACADACRASGLIYNVYFYNDHMNHPDWLAQVQTIADHVLDATSVNPIEYFDK